MCQRAARKLSRQAGQGGRCHDIWDRLWVCDSRAIEICDTGQKQAAWLVQTGRTVDDGAKWVFGGQGGGCVAKKERRKRRARERRNPRSRCLESGGNGEECEGEREV